MTTDSDTPDNQDIMKAIETARNNGLSQASGAGFAMPLDADDQTNPEQALADNPHINVHSQLGMAAFDLVVRGAISVKYAVEIQNKQFNDPYSMTGTDGTLQAYFEERFEDTPEEKKKKETEEALRDAVENAQERREREREEWERTSHSYGGLEMTGAEWSEFSDRITGDTPLRKWLLERQRQKGKTDAEAKQIVDQMGLLSKMQSLPPDQWTPEMQALNAKLQADPKLERELQENLREAKYFDSKMQVAGPNVRQDGEISTAITEASATNGADALSQSLGAKVSLPSAKPDALVADSPASQFPSAPNLGEHHRAAVAATEPLDAPKQIAALTPTPSPTAPGSGFDV